MVALLLEKKYGEKDVCLNFLSEGSPMLKSKDPHSILRKYGISLYAQIKKEWTGQRWVTRMRKFRGGGVA